MILKQIILDLINTNIRNKVPKVIKSEHANVEEALLDAIFIPFQVIELDCTQQFIDDNFDLAPGGNMGLGKNAMVGFAMCNGNNGTKDRRKRTSVGYDPSAYVSGPNFSIIGDVGGDPDAVVVSHSHDTVANAAVQGNFDETKKYLAKNRNTGINIEYELQGTDVLPTLGKTSVAGEDGVGKNMQPYIVTLFIQRI